MLQAAGGDQSRGRAGLACTVSSKHFLLGGQPIFEVAPRRAPSLAVSIVGTQLDLLAKPAVGADGHRWRIVRHRFLLPTLSLLTHVVVS